jgi:hypothetical protein
MAVTPEMIESFQHMMTIMNAVAIDCEMVGVKPSNKSALAHVAIVDFFGNQIYNKYVLPSGGIESISDYEGKITVYVYPYKDKTELKYIGNFLDLDNTSIPMLKEIQKLYTDTEHICFLHSTFTPAFYCLHFHLFILLIF